MKDNYIDLILSIERLHRRFLDVVKSELDRLKIEDVNNVQTLILYNISDEELTVGELTNRGYYLGSNVSYNVKKLVENEYLVQERAPHDKRSVKIRLSDKGLQLCNVVDELYERHVGMLNQTGFSQDDMQMLTKLLGNLETFWSGQLSQGYKH